MNEQASPSSSGHLPAHHHHPTHHHHHQNQHIPDSHAGHLAGHFPGGVYSPQSACMSSPIQTPKYMNSHNSNSPSTAMSMFGSHDHAGDPMGAIYNSPNSHMHPLYYANQRHFSDYDARNNYDCSRNNSTSSYFPPATMTTTPGLRSTIAQSSHLSSSDMLAASMIKFHSQNQSNYDHYRSQFSSNLPSETPILHNNNLRATPPMSNNNDVCVQNLNRCSQQSSTVCEPASVASYSSNYSLEDDDDPGTIKPFVQPYSQPSLITRSPPIGYTPQPQMYNNCCPPLGLSSVPNITNITQSPSQSESDAGLFAGFNPELGSHSCTSDKRNSMSYLPHTPPTPPASTSDCKSVNNKRSYNMNNNQNQLQQMSNSTSGDVNPQFDPKTGKLKVYKKRGRPRKIDKLNMLTPTSMSSSPGFKDCDPYTFTGTGELQHQQQQRQTSNSQQMSNDNSSPSTSLQLSGKRPRGRPRLNDPNRSTHRPKNMPTMASLIPAPGQPAVKRGRGRPKSIKTIIREAELIAADALATSGDIPSELLQFLEHQKRLLLEQQQQKLTENESQTRTASRDYQTEPEMSERRYSEPESHQINNRKLDMDSACAKLPHFSSILSKPLPRNSIPSQSEPFHKLAPIQTLNPHLKPLKMNETSLSTSTTNTHTNSTSLSSLSSDHDDDDDEDTSSSGTNSNNSDDCDSGSDLDSDDSDNSEHDSDTHGSSGRTPNISTNNYHSDVSTENAEKRSQNQNDNNCNSEQNHSSNSGQKRSNCYENHEKSYCLDDCFCCSPADMPLPKLVLKRLSPAIDSYSVTLVDNSALALDASRNLNSEISHPERENDNVYINDNLETMNSDSSNVERQTIELLEMLVKKTSQHLLQSQFCSVEATCTANPYSLSSSENSIKT